MFYIIVSFNDSFSEGLQWKVPTVIYSLNVDMVTFDSCHPCNFTCFSYEEGGTLADDLTIHNVLVTGLAGCMGTSSFPDAEVIAGPNGDFRFEPDVLRISPGETVRWGFASAGHNVCALPSVSAAVSIPSGAEGFASFGPNESPHGSLVPREDTYEQTVEVAGRYKYVCVPHVSAGMTAEIVVQ